MKLVDHCI